MERARGGARVTLTMVATLAGLGAAAALSAIALALRVARNVVTPPRERVEDIAILDVDPDAGTIRLGRTPDSVVPGRYSLWFDRDRGHARVGAILASDDESVTRELNSVQRGDLRRADHARWGAWWYLTPADLGHPFHEVGIDTEVGVAPAWVVPAPEPGGDWVIQVHGRGVTRAEGLRAVDVMRRASLTSLLISYRNDGDAPASHDGRYALGGDEWRDVESAIRYAIGQGAERIVLMGWSMGGATVLQCVMRSPFAENVIGVVLDSPVVDWVRVLQFHADAMGVPTPVRRLALDLLESPSGSRWVGLDSPIDFARLDVVARADELSIPMLLLHSDDDGYVPIDGSAALAAARPDLIRLERFATARHIKLWNLDPARWERAITNWLSGVATAPSGRTAPHRRPRAAGSASG